MAFKINIGTQEGKTYKLETEAESLVEKELGGKVDGKDISDDLEGYEFEITGASDSSGFTALGNVEGRGKKRVLLTYGKALKKRPKKEGKKKHSNMKPKGLRMRKTVRGKVITEDFSQINLKPVKKGKKSLKDIFEKPAEGEESGESSEGQKKE
ncbi:MAG TPA: S6e family ribosomal protein [Candidatus Nanoarchaeia archaeon]|nr:S6e family ribosomal protein [Candidatus Nanoarchaeia archaeon]